MAVLLTHGMALVLPPLSFIFQDHSLLHFLEE